MSETFKGITPADAARAENMAETILNHSSGTIYATELALSVLVRVVERKMGPEQARTWAQEDLVRTIMAHFIEYENPMPG
jgi:hypothetical protein